MERRVRATALALLAVSFAAARADDEAQLSRALQFSRQLFAQTQWIAEVTLQSREEQSLPSHFTYERRRNVERIKTELGQVFARKKGGSWLKSDDWAKTGTGVAPNEVADLASRVYLVNSPWNTNQNQEGDVTTLVTHSNDENGEHFVFERAREDQARTTYPRYSFIKRTRISGSEPLLEQFSGPVTIGNQRLVLTVQYTVPIEQKNVEPKTRKSSSRNRNPPPH